MAESLMDKRLLASTASERGLGLLPKVHVVGIGGGSIMDRGARAIVPLVRELVGLRRKLKLILGVSGGARTRHAYAIALDLGIPPGGLARIAAASEEQNAKLLLAMLGERGCLIGGNFWDIPEMLASGMIPVTIGMPPYHYWEQPPLQGRLPMNGSDLGLFMLAEAAAARALVFVKDRDGLFTADPARDRSAKLIRRVGARELLGMGLPSLPIEPMVLETMLRARHVRQFRVVNGLERGQVAEALAGKPVGTLVYAD